jgi:uncharacterized phiE125 gp8 family phage protein
MMLIEETTVPDAALPVEAFKAHLRIGTGFGEDDVQDNVLRGFLRAAIAAVEARTGKALIERGFSVVLSAWQSAYGQPLPVAPVHNLTALVLVDHQGTETPMATEAYWLEQDAQRPRVRPRSLVLPTVPQDGSARIAFVAGYGAGFDAIPPDLAQAVLMLAAHFYEYRDAVAPTGGAMPFGVASLIERYRTLRIGGGSV